MDAHTTEPTGPTGGRPADPATPTPDPVPDDAATDQSTDRSRTAADKAEHDHDDALADEWGKESFPSSDPPGHY